MRIYNTTLSSKCICILIYLCFGTDSVANAQINNCDTLVCHSGLILKGERGNIIKVQINELLSSAYCVDRSYGLEYSKNGKWLPLGDIDESFSRFVEFRITDSTNLNSCIGYFELIWFNCLDERILTKPYKFIEQTCLDTFNPFTKGITIPDSFRIDLQADGKYIVKNWNHCGDVLIKIEKLDNLRFSCDSIYESARLIHWSATRPDKIKFHFTDTVFIRHNSIKDSLFRARLDQVGILSFNCHDQYQVDKDSLPLGELTLPFSAKLHGCHRLGINYIDSIAHMENRKCCTSIEFLRKWYILDWCTADLLKFDQKIDAEFPNDRIPPTALCKTGIQDLYLNHKDSLIVSAKFFDAGSSDNCDEPRFSFDPKGELRSLTFKQKDTGSIISLTLWVIDSSDNISSCIVNVRIHPGLVLSQNEIHQANSLAWINLNNTNSDDLWLSWDADRINCSTATLINSHGQEIRSMTLPPVNNGVTSIPVCKKNQLNDGLYYLVLTSNKGPISLKFIKL